MWYISTNGSSTYGSSTYDIEHMVLGESSVKKGAKFWNFVPIPPPQTWDPILIFRKSFLSTHEIATMVDNHYIKLVTIRLFLKDHIIL